jgi:hypothetical protein
LSLEFLVLAAIATAANSANQEQNYKKSCGSGQQNWCSWVLVCNQEDWMFISDFELVSIVSTNTVLRFVCACLTGDSTALTIVVFSVLVLPQNNLTVVVNMFLLYWIDCHAHISHPVVVARWNGIGSLIVETVIGIHIHESITESDFINPGLAFVIELEIFKEAINSFSALFSTEKGGRSSGWE